MTPRPKDAHLNCKPYLPLSLSISTRFYPSVDWTNCLGSVAILCQLVRHISFLLSIFLVYGLSSIHAFECPNKVAFFKCIDLLCNDSFSRTHRGSMQTTHHKWNPSLQQQKQPQCVWEDHLFGTFSARTGDRETLLHRGEPPRVSSVGTWHQNREVRWRIQECAFL